MHPCHSGAQDKATDDERRSLQCGYGELVMGRERGREREQALALESQKSSMIELEYRMDGSLRIFQILYTLQKSFE